MGTKTTTTMDPAQAEFMQVLTGAAKDIAGTDYTPYTGERVAGMTGLQTNALEGYGGLTLPSEIRDAGGIMSQIAGRTPEQRAADISSYTQQYTQNVIDPTIAAMERQRSKDIVGEEAALIGSGAFGSRGDVFQGERAGEYDARMGQTLGQLQAQGYQSAVSRAAQEDAQRLAAAGQLAGVGGQVLQGQSGILSSQMSAGEALRGLDQQALEAAYQDYMMEQQWPLTQFGALSGAGAAFPAGIGTTTEGGAGHTLAAIGDLGQAAMIMG
jgi:hypothetical protein